MCRVDGALLAETLARGERRGVPPAAELSVVFALALALVLVLASVNGNVLTFPIALRLVWFVATVVTLVDALIQTDIAIVHDPMIALGWHELDGASVHAAWRLQLSLGPFFPMVPSGPVAIG